MKMEGCLWIFLLASLALTNQQGVSILSTQQIDLQWRRQTHLSSYVPQSSHPNSDVMMSDY
ncbi:hypothetical protein AALO_G00225160 [Alosa alosa]|uniref:Uncharacterized protein n=1 Tax=Alosa alosa TaxID=278164 RepID=A0AAV6G2P6_9TELE|nr:hypothetical protein AALO_G00225160 [Alosa alosa]